MEEVISAARKARREGDLAAADKLFAGLLSDDLQVQSAAETAVRRYGSAMAGALGSPMQVLLAGNVSLVDHAQEIWQWWCAKVDETTVRGMLNDRKRVEQLRHRRDEIKRGRALAAPYVHTDLYLTGPPFPGPR